MNGTGFGKVKKEWQAFKRYLYQQRKVQITLSMHVHEIKLNDAAGIQ